MKALKLLFVTCFTVIASSFVFADNEITLTEKIPEAVIEFPMISQDKALEDYDYMWRILEDNYPFFGVAERKYGLNADNIKQTFRTQIAQHNTLSVDAYYKIIKQCLDKFKLIGHLGIIDDYLYRHYVDLLSLEAEELNIITDTATNPIAQRTYEYLYPHINTFMSSPGSTVSNNKFLSMRIIDDKTAYMKIDAFNGTDIDSDGEKIKNFYNEIKDKENLIIDLTKNSGGYDDYWKMNIVEPNLSEEIEMTQYFLSKPGELNIECFKSRLWDKSAYESEDEYIKSLYSCIEEVSDLPNINKDDLNSLGMAIKDITVLGSNDNKEKAFNGKIYVLTSNKIFSASESFVMFCKTTGFATLVGTNTYGDGGGIGPMIFMMPNSGILIRYSAQYTLNADGSSNQEFGTTPDHFPEAGETALNACLRIIEEQTE